MEAHFRHWIKKIVIATFFFSHNSKKKFSVVWYKLPIANHKVQFCGGGEDTMFLALRLYMWFIPWFYRQGLSPRQN